MVKRGRGRPPKSDEDRRDAELRIRLTTAERSQLDAAAVSDTSTWARELLLLASRAHKAELSLSTRADTRPILCYP